MDKAVVVQDAEIQAKEHEPLCGYIDDKDVDENNYNNSKAIASERSPSPLCLSNVGSGVCDTYDQTCDHFSRPMLHVGDVLREAEDLMSERGHSRAQPTENGSKVLLDEVDVEYSPRHSAHPIEIVVRHNRVLTQKVDERRRKPVVKTSCSNSDATSTLHQPSYRFRTIAETEEGEKERENHQLPDDKANGTATTVKHFKRGHRRAFSMPTAANRMTLSIVDDDQIMADGLHKRHVVRYRLHPHRFGGGHDCAIQTTNAANATKVAGVIRPQLIGMRSGEHQNGGDDDDDNELAIEINEEEIICVAEGDETSSGARTVIKKFWEARWKVTNFEFLPVWLQDNEYLRTGHRPPLPSFGSCFKSIFSLHTETGNIWTHLYGCVAFVGVALFFLTRSNLLVQWPEKVVFSFFFMGAISCLGMSFAFHTVQCHSAGIGKLFSKLDYTGISLLIVGSFIPWIYYGFYCRTTAMLIYMSMICILGVAAVIVSLWDKFAVPHFRPVRAAVFVAMGLSSIVPAFHFFITDGVGVLIDEASLHWLLLMGLLYLVGAGVYASRVPERCFPGKCDLLFQSHQLFHLFVVVAALVHFHGISEMAMKRLEQGSCSEQIMERYGEEYSPSMIDRWLNIHPV